MKLGTAAGDDPALTTIAVRLRRSGIITNFAVSILKLAIMNYQFSSSTSQRIPEEAWSKYIEMQNRSLDIILCRASGKHPRVI